jgi:aspartate aminotransferase
MNPTFQMRDSFKKRRDLCFDHLSQIEGLELSLPEGAFYLFPDISSFFGKSFNGKTMINSQDICMHILNEEYLVTVAGSAFGNDNCIRLSYATSEDNLLKAMDRMKSALNKLK